MYLCTNLYNETFSLNVNSGCPVNRIFVSRAWNTINVAIAAMVKMVNTTISNHNTFVMCYLFTGRGCRRYMEYNCFGVICCVSTIHPRDTKNTVPETMELSLITSFGDVCCSENNAHKSIGMTYIPTSY